MSIEHARDWRGLRAVGRLVALTLDLLERDAAIGKTAAELDAGAAAFMASASTTRSYTACPIAGHFVTATW